ncbi:MAG: LacI family DNA-binding transcriptional regulator [Bacteroidales bacterium]
MKDNSRRIRIKDIASMANVSIGTVDRVLHNRGEVNEETRKKIQQIIEELGYMPNLLAKSLASKKQLSIAVIIPEFSNEHPYWENPLNGVTKANADLSDFNVSISSYKFNISDEATFIQKCQKVLDAKPNGVVLTPVFQESSILFIDKLNESGIPYILIDSNIEEAQALAYFGQDAEQSGYIAAKIMCMSLPKNAHILITKLANKKASTRHLQRRERGFLNFIQSEYNTKNINCKSIEIDLNDIKNLDEILDSNLNKDLPDGIFVTNSKVYLVAEYLTKRQIKNIPLIGYDLLKRNVELLKNESISFLICQKPEKQGYHGVVSLFNYLNTRKPLNRINYSPIDILMKENLDYYINNKNTNNE